MTRPTDLTGLPEWSDFFRAALLGLLLHFDWRKEGAEWVCRTYEFSRDLTRPIEEITLARARAPDRFAALRRALELSDREIDQGVWDAFYSFRAAANGSAGDIEDLL